MTVYTYRGDRWTRPELRGARCTAVRRGGGHDARGRVVPHIPEQIESHGIDRRSRRVEGQRRAVRLIGGLPRE